MIKVLCGAVSMLSLLVAGLLMWQTPGFAEALPVGKAEWILAWIELFRNPVAAVPLFLLCISVAVLAASVTELLLGLIFSLFAASLSVLCLLGVLANHYPPVVEYLEKLL